MTKSSKTKKRTKPAATAWLVSLAVNNEANFLRMGEARTAVFLLKNGRKVAISLARLRSAGWPQNIALYESLSKGRKKTGAELLQELADLAAENGGELLDTEWHGTLAQYRFRHSCGKEFLAFGGSIKSNGWPKDLEARAKRSELRRREAEKAKARSGGKRTPKVLMEEFRALVEANKATVVTPEWLGARVPHEVRLRDGSIRSIKPNQLKHYGWPIEPMVELQKWCLEKGFCVLSSAWRGPNENYLFLLPNGFFVEATPARLRAMAKEGLVEKSDAAIAWTRSQGIEINDSHWKGASAVYNLTFPDGKQAAMSLREAMRGRMHGHGLDIGSLKSKARSKGVELLSTEWQNDGVYQWKLADGRVVSGVWQDIADKLRGQERLEKLHELAGANGAKLLSDSWAGMSNGYLWELADGTQQRATPCAMRSLSQKIRENQKFLQAMRNWARVRGMQLLSTQWLGTKGRYNWELSGGYRVTCTRADLVAAILEAAIQSPASLVVTEEMAQAVVQYLQKARPPGLLQYSGALKMVGSPEDKLAKLIQWSNDAGLELLEKSWLGSRFKYSWRLPSGAIKSCTYGQLQIELSNGLRDYLAEVNHWCSLKGVKLLSPWAGKAAVHDWELPGGEVIRGPWGELKEKLAY